MSKEPRIDRRALLAASGTAFGIAAFGVAVASATETPVPSLGSIARLDGRIPVAFVMGDGATMIDFAGPWEVFQDVSEAEVPGFYLYTVSDKTDEIGTTGSMTNGRMHGLRFRPDYTFANAPQPQVIVMGAQGGHTPAKIDWIRKAAEKAEFVLSVCTGAFLLAKTGLLDGLTATTHHDFFDKFDQQFPKVKLVRDARYVDNGKFISAGGLTSGVDGALHIVDRIYGRAVADQIVRYMEYSGDGWRTRTRA